MCEVEKKVRVNTLGLMVQHTKGNGWKTKLTATVSTCGLTEENTMDSGPTTTCRVVEFTFMQMVSGMMVNTRMTRKKAMGVIFGLMVENMRVGGIKANSMVLDFTLTKLSNCSNTDFGKMESE
jgi:hypothetical protein